MLDKDKALGSGIYIHIPFCKSRCLYCGFYSTVGTSLRQKYVEAVCCEMRLRPVSRPLTLYLGGGTPSQLSDTQLTLLFETLQEVYGQYWYYHEGKPIEVTIECNPDDVDDEFTALLQRLPINRVSMGVQTFNDSRLRFLHRRHNSTQATEAVKRLRNAGINNLSIDLMFGFPNETADEWIDDIDKALALDVEHLSAYCLMYEEGTPLRRMLDAGELSEIDEDTYIIMYDTLVERLRENGYEHYEISNFARPGYRSRHNSSYWDGTHYIGLGAAAHSYDGEKRYWNIADVQAYIHSLGKGIIPSESEEIDLSTRFNDLITTRLRTCEGIDLRQLRAKYGEFFYDYLLKNSKQMIAHGWMALENGHLRLTLEGIHVSDTVMGELVYIED